MPSVSYLGLFGSIAVAWLIYAIQKLVRVRRFYKDLPKPPHSFLWGHLKLMGEISSLFPPQTHPQYYYTEIAKRYDMPDVWYVDLWPVGPPQMIVTGPDAAMEVLVTKVYPIHNWVNWWLSVMFGPNVIAGVNGTAWKTLHHMIGPSFTPMAVKSQTATIAEHAMIYHQKLRDNAETGQEFSMVQLTSHAIFDVISSIVLGFPLNAQQNGSPLLDDFKTIFESAQPYIDSWNPYVKVGLWWKMRAAKRRTDEYIHRELGERYNVFRGAEALPTRKTARSILDRMLVQRIEDMGDLDEPDLDPDFVKLVTPNLKGLLAGGQGTTSDTLCYIFMFLGMYPDVMKLLREEHDRIFGADLNTTHQTLLETPSKTSELQYTSAVIKESLRLFPIGFNPREAPVGVTTLQYKGRAYPVEGQMVVPNQHTGHLSAEHFPAPSEFLPDRFLESYEPKAHRYAWRPFERGPRACMGQELAMDEMRIVLLLTARWFDFETVVKDKAESPKVTFSDWDTRIGSLAFQELRMSAAPRGGMPMKVKLSGRA